MKHEILKREKGFTLIELVVVLALFVLMIDSSVGIFISIIKNQRRVLQEQEFLNQASYVEEYISKALRTSVKDQEGDCLGQNNIYFLTNYDNSSGFYQGIKILSEENICQEFFLDSDGILKELKSGGNPQPVLSSKFIVGAARFVINGDKTLSLARDADSFQPRVSVLLKVMTEINGAMEERWVQTTVSQRNLNL